MQLASQTRDPDQKMSPSIYAALIDSLFQNPGPLFAGALCAAIAAVMTALKTGNAWLWPCVALLIVTGAVRAFDMRQYQAPQVDSDRRMKPRAGKSAIRSARCSMPLRSGYGASSRCSAATMPSRT